jgi:hypothetical protein
VLQQKAERAKSKERRESRKQMRRKREKFSEEMRRERKKSVQIACGMVGSGAEEIDFLIFTKCTVAFHF